MKNYIAKGDVLDLTAPTGGVVSGTCYKIGAISGIAMTTAAAGAKFRMSVSGVFELPKVSAQAWAEGVKIYWDSTAGLATTVATANTLIGAASEAAANPSSLGRVRLNGTTV